MNDPAYDRGVMQGMEAFLVEAQAQGTFGALSTSIGKLTCRGDRRSPWNTGYMHGVSLAANIILDRANATLASRVTASS